MRAAETRPEGVTRRFVITPNCSLSWRGNLWFLLGIGLIVFTIAAIFAYFGMWLVLPFAGLEMLALAAAMYVVSHRCSRCEVIEIDSDRVSIEAGKARPDRRWQFARAWTQVVLQRSSWRSHPTRLSLRAHGRQVEVGACLNDEEREHLAANLRRALGASEGN